MLEIYRKKRDFAKTPEPSESSPPESGEKSEARLRFVVQKHAASHLHYDFRLEAGGVLKSWAVPKGPSLNPADKHLAIMVEDHPLGYAGFEGVIPEGEYGGGEVIVWDEGGYQPKTTNDRAEAEAAVLKGIEEGKLHFSLFGHKLQGEFVLTRMHGNEPKNWLLMKVTDEFATEKAVIDLQESVRSGKTIDEVKQSGSAKPVRATVYSPMLASEAAEPFDDPEWEFELKLDGVRAIATKQNGVVTLVSRNGNAVGESLSAVMQALREMDEDSFVLDGELVFFDSLGKPSFQQLMRRIRPDSPGAAHAQVLPGRIEYCIFDVLRLRNEDLRGKPLSSRRTVLDSLGLHGPILRVIDSYPENGKLLYENAIGMGFEGVMAKKLASKYESGRRSRSWLKVKAFHSEEFVVGGFTAGKGARTDTFGALLIGQRTASGDLHYSGKVGGGFSDDNLAALRQQLDSLISDRNPFADEVDAEERAIWVAPKLFVEVKFMARTQDNRLRFPVFLRTRPDREGTVVAESRESTGEKTSMKDDLLAQLDAIEDSEELTIGGHSLKVSHLSKALWPETKSSRALTKRDLLRYYAAVAEEMLPFLKDRPISFVRHPDGIGEPGFFQKHPLPGMPDFVSTVKIWTDHSSKALDWILCDNLETLMWLGQVGTVEIHPWYSRIAPGTNPKLPVEFESADGLDASALDYPDFIVLDLDPNIEGSAKELGQARGFDRQAWDQSTRVALALRELLQTIGLDSLVKSSGKTGLHVYVPIERRYHYDQVKAMAQTLGQQLETQMPDEVTMVWTVKKRPSAVFVDHNQNVRGKTLAAPFSPRVSPSAPVSFPVSWDTLVEFDPTQVTIQTATGNLEKWGNPWRAILDHPQKLNFDVLS